MTIGTKIFTFFHGRHVGDDQFGNRYFESKRAGRDGKIKRWVMYNGKAEASKIPPEWHLWIHYTSDNVPSKKYKWQKDHVPNLTGTKFAYMPPGHILNGQKDIKTTSDYESWNPDN
ncbi:NADH:ubiquinone oxidoreductase subunit NDUFA12 [Rickettsiales bacterium]|nr:NADH:ubiquinone oxidoreductase subunit NDUFA12 [Rickettsiales bacterium]